MVIGSRVHFRWQLRTRALQLGERTLVMGIVNVTPDSFSDGGQHTSMQAGVAHALQLLEDGADVVDIGGESTKPGSTAATADAVTAREEQQRVLPVIAGVLQARPDAVISIDTYRASTARLAVEAGAEIVNDVSGGLWDPKMLATCAALQCGVIVMHARGLPSEWASQASLGADEVLPLVLDGLNERVAAAITAGVKRERIVVDPGFGFGKRGPENWALLAGVEQLHTLGLPVVVGLSRKGFLDPLKPASARDEATHAAGAEAVRSGAHMLRVHDVCGAVRSSGTADLMH